MTKQVSTALLNPAFELSAKVIKHLINNWSPHGNKVLYSVNIPMVERLLHEDGMRVYWTSVWRNNYGRMFSEVPRMVDSNASGEVWEATLQGTNMIAPREGGGNPQDIAGEENLVFKFNPDFSELDLQAAAPEGTDGWVVNADAVSVTPYLTSFAELPEGEHSFSCLQDREWKFEL